MDFTLTNEQELIKESLREWCERNIPMERIREMETAGHPLPDDIPKGLGELGVLMGTVPEEDGGSGLDWFTQALVAEEIGYADISAATVAACMAVMTGWGYTINKYASDKVKKEAVVPALKGQKFIGIAATEPGGGSDVSSHKSTAKKDGDHWILNGEKTFISGVEEARKWGGGYWVNVNTNNAPDGPPHKNMSAFYVPVDAEGFEPDEPYRDAGRLALSTSGFRMENVRVPEENLFGEVGRGFYYTMEGFDNARILIAAGNVGTVQRILDDGMEYIKEREAFGRPIAKFEGIQFELVELYRELEELRLLVYKTAWMQDQRYQNNKFKPTEVAKWISMCKWKGAELAVKAADRAMHWLGAAGYSDEYPFEMAWRGNMSYSVGAEGAKNIQKLVVGRELLGKEYIPYK